MFTITSKKGFQITFQNGVTISAQFGKGNYCENRFKENPVHDIECADCEVAVFLEEENLPRKYLTHLFFTNAEKALVKADVTPDELAEAISRVKNFDVNHESLSEIKIEA